ncbi:MAG TPA: hypothetical protein VEL05_05545 [Candidatus Acidoferrum sp.]|nr:hypothetical protein [Candidatus Acidoferrum sp.]
MASHAELAYTGIVETLGALDREFALRAQAAPGHAELVGGGAR